MKNYILIEYFCFRSIWRKIFKNLLMKNQLAREAETCDEASMGRDRIDSSLFKSLSLGIGLAKGVGNFNIGICREIFEKSSKNHLHTNAVTYVKAR